MVLGAVARVAESFLAARVLAQIWLFSSVAPQVDLQVFQAGKGLVTALKHTLVGFLSRVDPHVNEQFIASVEGFVSANAASPEAGEVLAFSLIDVHFLNVPDKLLLLLISSAAVDPATHLFITESSCS